LYNYTATTIITTVTMISFFLSFFFLSEVLLSVVFFQAFLFHTMATVPGGILLHSSSYLSSSFLVP
jgi:hypothetical protein